MHVKRARLSIQTPPPSRHSLVVALFPSTYKRSTPPRTAIVCCFECVQCARWDKIRTSDRHMRARGGEFNSLSSVFQTTDNQRIMEDDYTLSQNARIHWETVTITLS